MQSGFGRGRGGGRGSHALTCAHLVLYLQSLGPFHRDLLAVPPTQITGSKA